MAVTRAPCFFSSSIAAEAGALGTDHHEMLSLLIAPFDYLNFNVVSANSAIISPAIQKRTMTFDSGQPSASK